MVYFILPVHLVLLVLQVLPHQVHQVHQVLHVVCNRVIHLILMDAVLYLVDLSQAARLLLPFAHQDFLMGVVLLVLGLLDHLDLDDLISVVLLSLPLTIFSPWLHLST
jgi:hypothetical protein